MVLINSDLRKQRQVKKRVKVEITSCRFFENHMGVIIYLAFVLFKP